MTHPLERLRYHVTGAIERGGAVAVVERPTPAAFWSYQAATATPSLQAAIDVGAISATTTQAQWDAMSPGMRREIVRSLTKAGKA